MANHFSCSAKIIPKGRQPGRLSGTRFLTEMRETLFQIHQFA
jgi:hypothetical protein